MAEEEPGNTVAEAALTSTSLIGRRDVAGAALVAMAADIVAAAQAAAERFDAGGVLHAFGDDDAEADAHHIAVEFVHPVIVGKRALPAVALPCARAEQHLATLARPADIALAICPTDPDAVSPALRTAARRGLLTVAITAGVERPGGWDGVGHVLTLPAADPLTTMELQVTVYHLIWELTQVVLERSGNSPTTSGTPAAEGRSR